MDNLILSKRNYALAVVDLPLWVLNCLYKNNDPIYMGDNGREDSQENFINIKIDGDLQLIGVESKNRAFRIKHVKTYLYDDIDYGWKCLMGYFLNEVMNIEDHVLLMKLRKPMRAGIPFFLKGDLVRSSGIFGAFTICGSFCEHSERATNLPE